MKEIILLRHAKSSWDNPTISDHQRKLNDRGIRDMPKMVEWLIERGQRIDLVLSSDSQRTIETCAFLHQKFTSTKFEFTRDLYLASEQEILEVINDLPDNYSSVMIVAHNPGITYAYDLLADVHIDNVPTAGLGLIAFDVRKFSEIEAKTGKLEYFTYPKKITGN